MNRFSDIPLPTKRLPPVGGYWNENLVSLEIALKPVESLFHELPRSIKQAKKYCTFPSTHGLTHDESAAVYLYTMEGGENSFYGVLNTALRSENRPALKPWFAFLKLFDVALKKLPTVKGSIWRGVPGDIRSQFTKGQVLTWWSVSSCSQSMNVIQEFLGTDAKTTIFMIEAVNAKDVSNYTYLPQEDEVILRVGTELRVKSDSFTHPSGLNIVHLVELTDDVEALPAGIVELDLQPTASATGIAVPLRGSWVDIHPNARWKEKGQTVGGRDPIQSSLWGVFVAEDQTIYGADRSNNRIVAWEEGETQGQVVAGGNGRGKGDNQLDGPTDVIVDKESDSLVICDFGNKRVVRWPCQNGTRGETILSNIACWGLTMDDEGSLYVTDPSKHEVRRYRRDDSQGTVVAGGNGKGVCLNQLHYPRYLFVDREHSIFVSEWENHRITKWTTGAKEGMVVAGGRGQGETLSQLSYPGGVLVDQLDTVYIADWGNQRVVRWPKGAQEGMVVADGNGEEAQANQLCNPEGLSFDRHGHLYVVDHGNGRVQKFTLEMPLK